MKYDYDGTDYQWWNKPYYNPIIDREREMLNQDTWLSFDGNYE